MTPLPALIYSFLFVHGILPDEHTWLITFSYAIGGASGKEGMKAGLYFSRLVKNLIWAIAFRKARKNSVFGFYSAWFLPPFILNSANEANILSPIFAEK